MKKNKTIEQIANEFVEKCRDWNSRFYYHVANGNALSYHPWTKTYGVAEMRDMLTPISNEEDTVVYNGVQFVTIVDGLSKEELLAYCEAHDITTTPKRKTFKDILAKFI